MTELLLVLFSLMPTFHALTHSNTPLPLHERRNPPAYSYDHRRPPLK